MPAYDVRELVHENGQAHLLLDGATYTLRITRAGKLILTK
ncbi:hemin uptake protein HemP [Sulfitobacter sp.]